MKLMTFDELQKVFQKRGMRISYPRDGYYALIIHERYTSEEYRVSIYRKLFKTHRSIVRQHFGISS